jgi:hypothetical protein
MPFNFFTLNTTNPMLPKSQYLVKSSYIAQALLNVGEQLEMLNYDLVGAMTNYVDGNIIRNEVEYNCDIVKAGHECIQLGLDMISPNNMYPMYKFGEIIIAKLIERIQTLPPLQLIINFEVEHKACCAAR